MTLFSENDRRLIEALSFDPGAEPSFEMLKGCLVWPDERPEGITPNGYETLCDLWIARGMIHAGTDPDRLAAPYRNAWTEAVRTNLQWPGLRRLKLSEIDREYLARELAAMDDDDAGL